MSSALAEARALTYLGADSFLSKGDPHAASPAVPLFDSADFSRAAGRGHRRRHAARVPRTASSSSRSARPKASSGTTASCKSASFDESQGFGLRAVRGETAAYAHATDLSIAALKRAAEVCRTVATGGSVVHAVSPERTNARLYADTNPAEAMGFSEKIALLQKADAYARGLDPRVQQVSVSHGGRLAGRRDPARRRVELPRRAPAGALQHLGRLRRWQGTGPGQPRPRRPGRAALLFHRRGVDGRRPRGAAPEPRLARSPPAPAGEMDVLLGPGWPGILLHEAVGHGLEGDFHRKKTSVFTGMLGSAWRRRASPSSMTAPSPTGAARSPSTMRERRRARPR